MTRLIAGLALCLATLLAWMGLMGRSPAEASYVTDPGLEQAREQRAVPIACLSYAPYRRAGDAPWHAERPIRPEQIREDLLLLQPLTQCVRTYGVDHGLDAVPAIARELGFKVKLGVWIGGDHAGNDRQLDRAIELAREYRDVVDLLIVGNEVLLRHELSPNELVGLLAKARAAAVAPVAYAEVWEFWERHAEILRAHVDVVAIHVLPYWEDEPVGVAQAVGHVQSVLRKLSTTFAPLPVWLAETGWPAAGRQRGPAVPGIQEQTRFMREWLRVAPPDYNLIEAFDQPWKRALEGAMGGHWGILDAQGRGKLAWHGPLPARLQPLGLIGGALAGGLLGMALVAARIGMRPLSRPMRPMREMHPAGARNLMRQAQRPSALAVGLLAGACLGPLTLLQYEMVALWSRTFGEWALGGLYALTALLCAVFALRSALGTADPRGLAGLVLALMIMTLLQALALVLDGRYRPLVWPMLLAPALSLLLLGAQPAQQRATTGPGRPRLYAVALLLLATALLGCAAALIAIEGTQNAQALQASMTWVLLAAGSVVLVRSGGPDHEHRAVQGREPAKV
jgi:exo-beta-1,3-glucanase (GH17 family)